MKRRGARGDEEEEEEEEEEDEEEEEKKEVMEEEEELQGVTRSYKEKANSNRPIVPYKAVRYLT